MAKHKGRYCGDSSIHAHLKIQKQWHQIYVHLRWQGTKQVLYLGKVDVTAPTPLLDLTLAVIPKLDVEQLRRLLSADKSMRW